MGGNGCVGRGVLVGLRCTVEVMKSPADDDTVLGDWKFAE